MENMIKIKLKRSIIGTNPKQRKTIEALGLKKINQVVEKPNNGQTQGMINVVKHLIEVE